jgi:hypothetical protein
LSKTQREDREGTQRPRRRSDAIAPSAHPLRPLRLKRFFSL